MGGVISEGDQARRGVCLTRGAKCTWDLMGRKQRKRKKKETKWEVLRRGVIKNKRKERGRGRKGRRREATVNTHTPRPS